MKIETAVPVPPPREIRMTFPAHEGWAIMAALREYADLHPGAVHAENWREWAFKLDKELRK